jgi:nucleoside-diphosphate-sugar epimerase
MRVFVTGATGFIGSAIVQELSRVRLRHLGSASLQSSQASFATLDGDDEWREWRACS